MFAQGVSAYGGCLPMGVSAYGVSAQRGVCLGVSALGGVYLGVYPGGICPGGCLSRRVSARHPPEQNHRQV